MDKSQLPNPFPGLRPFRSDEYEFFFGREQQTMELLDRLERTRFVAVVGSSGRGKSSLVRCGLLTELEGGKLLAAGAHWKIALAHPGGDPLNHVAEALLDAGLYSRTEPDAVLKLVATLSRSQHGLIEAVHQAHLPPGTNFLLVIDQFEEIFRFNELGSAQREVADHFVTALLEATAQKQVPIYVVITMRSDFIGDCSEFEGLAEAVNRGEFLIPRLTREQFKSVIEGPIRVAGGRLAPRLLQRLLNDLGEEQDQLPCLQHALMRTWNAWARRQGDELDLEDYHSAGKMSQALSLHADEVFAGLADDRQRQLCAALFKALTVQGSEKRGIRRPRRLKTLCRILNVDAAELIPVIDAFRARGVTFLMPPPEVPLEADTVIDISHESLMRIWARLRTWVEEEAQSAGIFRRLSESAALWQSGKAGLYRDPELSIAQAWAKETRPNAAWAEQYEGSFDKAMAFLEQSRQAADAEKQAQETARQRELQQARALAEQQQLRAEEQTRAAVRLRWFVRGLGLIALIAITASAIAIAARQESRLNARLAEANATEARRQASRAQAAQAKAERQNYFANVSLASSLIKNGQLERAREVLERESVERYRGWEWGWLEHLNNRDRMTLRGYSNWISSAVFSPDGKTIVTSGDLNGVVKVWNAQTGAELRAFTFGEPIWWVAFSPDGKRLALSGLAQAVKVIDFDTGREVLSLVGHSGPVNNVVFSPDGKWLVTASFRDRTARIWDGRTGQAVRTITAHTEGVRALAFSPNGKHLATGSWDKTARIWEVETGRETALLTGHSHNIFSVAFSADGRRLATGSFDRTVGIWDVETGKELTRLTGFSDIVTAVAFSHSGALLAVGAFDNKVRLFDASTWSELTSWISHSDFIQSVAFSPDDTVLVTGSYDQTAKVWDATLGSHPFEIQAHNEPIWSVAFSPDGRLLATGSWDKTAKIWDLEEDRLLLTLPAHFPVIALVFSQDGKRLLTSSSAGTARVWDTQTGRALQELRGHSATILAIALSPDGKRIMTGSKDQTARIWDADSGKELSVLSGHGEWVMSVAFSPDGKRVITGSVDGTARIWDAQTGRPLRSLEGQNAIVLSAGFSPNGHWIVTGNGDGAVQMWDAESGRRLAPIGSHRGGVRSMTFSPDNRLLVTAGGGFEIGNTNRSEFSAKVFDLENGRELLTLDHSHPVFSAAFSPDGRRIATGDGDGRVKIWEAFPWRTDEYPGSSHSPFAQRLAEFKREHWPKRVVSAGRLALAGKSAQADPRAKAMLKPVISPRESDAWPELIDLSHYYNAGLNERWHPGDRELVFMDYDLATLPQGLQRFGGVLFDVRGVIQLYRNATNWETFPRQVTGIPIKQKCHRLYILHATVYGGTVTNGTPIGEYVIRYVDGSREELPIVYGRDLLDWSINPNQSSETNKIERGIEAW